MGIYHLEPLQIRIVASAEIGRVAHEAHAPSMQNHIDAVMSSVKLAKRRRSGLPSDFMPMMTGKSSSLFQQPQIQARRWPVGLTTLLLSLADQFGHLSGHH